MCFLFFYSATFASFKAICGMKILCFQLKLGNGIEIVQIKGNRAIKHVSSYAWMYAYCMCKRSHALMLMLAYFV